MYDYCDASSLLTVLIFSFLLHACDRNILSKPYCSQSNLAQTGRTELLKQTLPPPLRESHFTFTELFHASQVTEITGTAVCQCRTRPFARLSSVHKTSIPLPTNIASFCNLAKDQTNRRSHHVWLHHALSPRWPCQQTSPALSRLLHCARPSRTHPPIARHLRQAQHRSQNRVRDSRGPTQRHQVLPSSRHGSRPSLSQGQARPQLLLELHGERPG